MIMREKFVKTTWFVLLLLSSLTSAYVTDEFVRFLQEQSALNRNETSQSPDTGTLRVTSQEVPSETSSSGSRLNALCRHQRLDLLFVLDGSKSVKAQNFQKMLEFTSEMAGSFTIGRDSTQVAVMQYSGCIHPHIYLNDQTSVRELQSVILGIKYEAKGTATGRALRFASHKMFSKRKGARDVGGGARRTMIFITDGKWSIKEEISDAVRQLEDKHVERFAIGIGKTARSANLSSIVSNPIATHHRYITDYVSLTQVRQDFLQELCREEQPCQDGNIDVINATGYDVIRMVGMETKVGVNRAEGSNDEATVYGVRRQSGVIVSPTRSLFKQRLPRKFAIISIFRMLEATPHISWNLLEFGHRNGNVTIALKIAGDEEEVHYVMHDIIGGKHTVKFKKVSKLFRSGYHKVALYVSQIQASLYIDCSGPEHRPLSALPDRDLPDGDIAVARNVVTRDTVAVDIQQLWIVCSATYQSHSDVFDCFDVGRRREKNNNAMTSLTSNNKNDNDVATLFSEEASSRSSFPVQSLPGGQVRFPQNHVIASVRSQPIEETPRLGDVTGGDRTVPGSVELGLKQSPAPGRLDRSRQCLPGWPGLRGPKGHHGDRGEVGKRGMPGRYGQQGNPGASGHRGSQGAGGPPGPQGFKGEKGPPGTKGDIGRIGAPGITGHMGPPGTPGYPGRMGTPGASGPKGERGTSGDVGRPGPPGKEGLRGRDGAGRGRPGEKGKKGSHGMPGARGAKGEIGFRGLPGLRGEDGMKGVEGAPGNDGKSGRKGEEGFPGIPGIMGPTGAKGNRGPRGEKGSSGVSGPRGDPGKPGQKGQRGIPGVAGFPGAPGYVGPKGHKGMEGAVGKIGKVGRPGSPGVDGKKGDPGPRGPQGKEGLIGPPGARGPQGPPGAIGLPGFKGSTGRTGPQGKTGLAGERGPQGPQGPTRSLEEIEVLIRRTLSEMIPVYTNVLRHQRQRCLPPSSIIAKPGPPGDNGPPGQPGQPGMKGNQGPTGVPGIQGSRGQNGARGAKGDKGDIGARGRSLQGPQGPPGPIGRPGSPGRSDRGMNGEKGTQGVVGPRGYPGRQGLDGTPGVCDPSRCGAFPAHQQIQERIDSNNKGPPSSPASVPPGGAILVTKGRQEPPPGSAAHVPEHVRIQGVGPRVLQHLKGPRGVPSVNIGRN